MKLAVLLLLVVSLAAPVDAQDAAIPPDPAVRIGRLENGLTYYIRRNTEPANRAELRLAVNTGSVLEEENERGIAHFLEHMLFNGTRRFKGPELVNFLERIGMEFGPDVNAYTSFDETVYMLKVAMTDKKNVETAFDVLEDWAGYATLATEEIDKERGVVVEEWRQRDKNAGGRIRDKVLPGLLGGSRYAERLPIGEMEVVRTAPAERFRAFYERWYRPDLMAVVAVGDFDPAWIESLIRSKFSSLAKPAKPAARPSHDVPAREGTRFLVVTDPENPATNVQVTFRREASPVRTVTDYRDDVEWGLFRDMLNTRLAEIARKPDAPFLGAFAGRQGLARAVDFYTVSARAHEGRAAEALEAVFAEVERVRRHGFTETELKRSKENLLRSYERAYNERDKMNSAAFADQYVDHFLTGEAIPSVEYGYDLARKLVPAVALADVNAEAARLVPADDRLVLVTAPEKAGLAAPTEADLAASLKRVQSAKIEPYVDVAVAAALVERAPAPVEITKERRIEELGVTEITLANGVRVLMKPTDFRNDQVLLASSSPGGSSLVPDADYPEAAIATAVAVQSGVGAFDYNALQRMLAGKQVSVAPSLSGLGEGFSGNASPKDLEMLFQLVYLHATAPRLDRAAFEVVKTQLRTALMNRSVTPGAALEDALIDALYGKTIRVGPLPLAEVEALDYDRLAALYRDRFADLGDSTFVVVGTFDVERVKALSRTWLGALPSKGRAETWRDVVPDPNKGVAERKVHKGREEQSSVQIVFAGPIEPTEENRRIVSVLDRALNIRIREELREELGGVYSPGVSASLQSLPEGEYRVGVSFSCEPKRADELVAAVFAVVDEFHKSGPSAELLAKAKEQEALAIEEQMRSNGFWLGTLLRLATTPGSDPRSITKFSAMAASVTPEQVQRLSRDMLRRDRYVKVVRHPEALAAAAAR